MKSLIDYKIQHTPILNTLKKWLKVYCSEVEIIDSTTPSIRFCLNGEYMNLEIDVFSSNACLKTGINLENHTKINSVEVTREYELVNMLNYWLQPYSFVWHDFKDIDIFKTFAINISSGLEFIIKIEIYRMYCLSRKISYALNNLFEDFFEDEVNWRNVLLTTTDLWVAGEILDMNILYIKDFSSSGHDNTVNEVQGCLPNCKVFSPDISINPAVSLDIVNDFVSKHLIDLVIGEKAGALFAMFARCRKKILLNPSFHVSESLRSEINCEADRVLRLEKSYANLESNVFLQSQLDWTTILGVFVLDDSIAKDREVFQKRSLNLREYIGERKIHKEAVHDVLIPSILQMMINEKR